MVLSDGDPYYTKMHSLSVILYGWMGNFQFSTTPQNTTRALKNRMSLLIFYQFIFFSLESYQMYALASSSRTQL